MSFYRAEKIGHTVLATYIVANEERSLVGYLVKAFYLGEISPEDFEEFYIKLCTDEDNPTTRRSAKQYLSLVNRLKHFEETGEDIIPPRI